MPRIAAANWPMISGLLRIAEIHVVGDRQRARADRGQVAPGLGHRLRAASLGVGGAVARRAVGGQRQRAGMALQPHHRGVRGPGRFTVWPPTVLSYWSQTQAREHEVGAGDQLSAARAVRPTRSSIRAGLSCGCFAVSAVGR